MLEVKNSAKYVFDRYVRIVQRQITNDKDEITTCCIGIVGKTENRTHSMYMQGQRC